MRKERNDGYGMKKICKYTKELLYDTTIECLMRMVYL